MTGYEFIYALSNVALISALVGLLVFIIRYAKSKWKIYGAGRSLMYFAVALAAMSLSGVLVLIFGPEYILREWVRLGLFTMVSIFSWRLVVSLVRVQRKGKYTPEQIQAALNLLDIQLHPERQRRTRYTPGEEIPGVTTDDDIKEGT